MSFIPILTSIQIIIQIINTFLNTSNYANHDKGEGLSIRRLFLYCKISFAKGIIVKLGMPCILNRINMLLWDRDQRAYSYYIGDENIIGAPPPQKKSKIKKKYSK